MLGRRSLLEERLVLRAVYVAFEHDRPPRNPAKRSLGHRQVVLYQVELRVAGVWKEYLVRVGDHHVAACGFQDGVHEEGAWSTSLVDGAPEPLRSSGAGARGLNLAIARLAREQRRPLELRTRLVEPAELCQKVTARTR